MPVSANRITCGRNLLLTTFQNKCVAWFIEKKSDIQVQRNFRTKFNKYPPSRPCICSWHKKFMETVVRTSIIILVGLGRAKKTLSESGRHLSVDLRSQSEGHHRLCFYEPSHTLHFFPHIRHFLLL
jgi:uracil-DNA glycosylase